jgi:hypothetical protein
MRYLKMLSLAAVVAAALMAVVGAGAAQAETTLCKVTEDACSTANMYPVGTSITAVTTSKATLKAGFVTVKCNGTLSGTTTTTTTPEGGITALGWTACEGAEEVVSEPTVAGGKEFGQLQVHWDAEHNGNLTAKNIRVRIKALGVTCFYGGTVSTGLTLKGGNPATVTANAEIERLSGSSVLCGNPANWTATYEVTAPKPLYVSKGL